MGRIGGVGKGHKLSEYIKLNDKPKSKRTKKFKENTFNRDYLGKIDALTRYDRENSLTGSY